MPVRSVLRPTIAGRFVPHAPAHANTGGSEPTNQQMADVNQTPAVTTQPVSGLGANIANISTTSTDSGTLSLTSEATSEGFVLSDNSLIYQSPAYMQAKAQASSAQSQVDYIQGVLTQANAGAYGASTSEVVNSTLFGKVNGVNWNMLNYYQGQVSDANSAMQSNAPVVVGTVSGTTITPTANTVTQPLYGNVSGQNQMLGTLSYVGKEDNGQFSLAYKSFTPGNVSVTGSIPSSQSPTGKIGYSVPADVSYNPASGSVSVVPEASYGGNLLPPITVTGTDMNSLFSMQTGIPLTTKTVYNITPSGTTSATSVTGFSQGGKTVTSLDTTMNGTKVNLSFGSGGIMMTSSALVESNSPAALGMGTPTTSIPKAFGFSTSEMQGSGIFSSQSNSNGFTADTIANPTIKFTSPSGAVTSGSQTVIGSSNQGIINPLTAYQFGSDPLTVSVKDIQIGVDDLLSGYALTTSGATSYLQGQVTAVSNSKSPTASLAIGAGAGLLQGLISAPYSIELATNPSDVFSGAVQGAKGWLATATQNPALAVGEAAGTIGSFIVGAKATEFIGGKIGELTSTSKTIYSSGSFTNAYGESVIRFPDSTDYTSSGIKVENAPSSPSTSLVVRPSTGPSLVIRDFASSAMGNPSKINNPFLLTGTTLQDIGGSRVIETLPSITGGGKVADYLGGDYARTNPTWKDIYSKGTQTVEGLQKGTGDISSIAGEEGSLGNTFAKTTVTNKITGGAKVIISKLDTKSLTISPLGNPTSYTETTGSASSYQQFSHNPIVAKVFGMDVQTSYVDYLGKSSMTPTLTQNRVLGTMTAEEAVRQGAPPSFIELKGNTGDVSIIESRTIEGNLGRSTDLSARFNQATPNKSWFNGGKSYSPSVEYSYGNPMLGSDVNEFPALPAPKLPNTQSVFEGEFSYEGGSMPNLPVRYNYAPELNEKFTPFPDMEAPTETSLSTEINYAKAETPPKGMKAKVEDEFSASSPMKEYSISKKQMNELNNAPKAKAKTFAIDYNTENYGKLGLSYTTGSEGENTFSGFSVSVDLNEVMRAQNGYSPKGGMTSGFGNVNPTSYGSQNENQQLALSGTKKANPLRLTTTESNFPLLPEHASEGSLGFWNNEKSPWGPSKTGGELRTLSGDDLSILKAHSTSPAQYGDEQQLYVVRPPEGIFKTKEEVQGGFKVEQYRHLSPVHEYEENVYLTKDFLKEGTVKANEQENEALYGTHQITINDFGVATKTKMFPFTSTTHKTYQINKTNQVNDMTQINDTSLANKTIQKQYQEQTQESIMKQSQIMGMEMATKDRFLELQDMQDETNKDMEEPNPSPPSRSPPNWLGKGGLNLSLYGGRYHQKRRKNNPFQMRQVKGQDYSIDLASYTLGLKGSRGKSYYKMTGLYRPYPKRGAKK